MEFMKKFRIGLGLQNFHIRTPLHCHNVWLKWQSQHFILTTSLSVDL